MRRRAAASGPALAAPAGGGFRAGARRPSPGEADC